MRVSPGSNLIIIACPSTHFVAPAQTLTLHSTPFGILIVYFLLGTWYFLLGTFASHFNFSFVFSCPSNSIPTHTIPYPTLGHWLTHWHFRNLDTKSHFRDLRHFWHLIRVISIWRRRKIYSFFVFHNVIIMLSLISWNNFPILRFFKMSCLTQLAMIWNVIRRVREDASWCS